MKKLLLSTLCLFNTFIVEAYSPEFIEYHVRTAIEEAENEDIYLLIQQLIADLNNAGMMDYSTRELINLIDEGYKIDPFNMAKLISVLDFANPSNNATKVLIKAIETNSTITSDHFASLIKLLTHANPSNNATKVIIKAIEHGINFGPKERLLLAEAGKVANARTNVEKIRQVLHEKASKK